MELNDCEPPCWYWKLKADPEEQSVLLTAEPSLQPLLLSPLFSFCVLFCCVLGQGIYSYVVPTVLELCRPG